MIACVAVLVQCIVAQAIVSQSNSHIVMKRAKPSSSSSGDCYSDLPIRVGKRLLIQGSTSKSALANTLHVLHEEGMLNIDGDHTVDSFRKNLQHAAEDTAKNACTPYGHILQKMHIGHKQLREWEFVHPFAYLSQLTKCSAAFASLMRDAILTFSTLSVIIYVDEIHPGNPLHADVTRKLECIYWTFAEFPQHILQRAECWLIFGVIRSNIVHDMLGDISGLMRKVLNVFWPSNGASLLTGIVVSIGYETQQVLTATFGGFLGDEKGLKEIYDIKGAAGKRPCPECANVEQFGTEDDRSVRTVGPDIVPISEPLYEKLVLHTNDTWWELIDNLAASYAVTGKTAFEKMQTQLGVNYNPYGLWHDTHLRQSVLRPMQNYLRDPMHTCVSRGVVNSAIYLFLVVSNTIIPLETYENFAKEFHVPSGLPKPKPAWFTIDTMDPESLSMHVFASEMLGMLPIIVAVAREVLAQAIPDHVRCLELLFKLVSIIQLGPDTAMKYVKILAKLVRDHAVLWKHLYKDFGIKPKWHHLLHIPHDGRKVNKILSCFVTERKHKDTKSAATWVFRYIEHTVTANMVNRQCERMIEADAIFAKMRLEKSSPHEHVKGLVVSHHAVLHCGTVKTSDVVYIDSRGVGIVKCFYNKADEFIVQADMLASTSNKYIFSTIAPSTEFHPCSSVIAPLCWFQRLPNEIRVILPVVVDL
jgi:hypothetical protein